MKINKLKVAQTIIGLIGFSLITLKGGLLMALGIFFVIWSNNFDFKKRNND